MTSTLSAQFLGAYQMARQRTPEEQADFRARLESKRAWILKQDGGPEGLEAVMLGFDACDMHMSETDARAWAERLRG